MDYLAMTKGGVEGHMMVMAVLLCHSLCHMIEKRVFGLLAHSHEKS